MRKSFLPVALYLDPSKAEIFLKELPESRNLFACSQLSYKLRINLKYDPSVNYEDILGKENIYITLPKTDAGERTLQIIRTLQALAFETENYYKKFARSNEPFLSALTFYGELLKNPREDVFQWVLSQEDFKGYEKVLLSTSIDMSPKEKFVPLLRLFYSRGLSLNHSTLGRYLKDLLEIENFEGIRELTKLYQDRPQYVGGLGLKSIRNLEALEVVREFLGSSRDKVGENFYEGPVKPLPPGNFYDFSFFSLLVDDYGFSLLKILNHGYVLNYFTTESLLEIIDHYIDKEEIEDFFTEAFIDYLSREDPHQEESFNLLLKKYPSKVRGKYALRSLKEGRGNWMSWYLTLSDSRRVQVFLEFIFSDLRDFREVELLFKGVGEDVGVILAYPHLLRELERRDPGFLEKLPQEITTFNEVSKALEGFHTKDAMKGYVDRVFEGILFLLEISEDFREEIQRILEELCEYRWARKGLRTLLDSLLFDEYIQKGILEDKLWEERKSETSSEDESVIDE